jgi:hypothetical protein
MSCEGLLTHADDMADDRADAVRSQKGLLRMVCGAAAAMRSSSHFCARTVGYARRQSGSDRAELPDQDSA